MANVIESYAKQVKDSGQDIIGMLAWYTVPSTAEIEYADFMNLVIDNDAPITKMKQPSPNNVFRRACSSSKLLKQPGPEDDIFCNYRFRDVSYDKTYIFKCLVEEQVDRANHTLDHRTVADVTFTKASHRVSFDVKIDDDDYAQPAYQALVQNLKDFIANKGSKMHDLVIREAARRSLEYMLKGVRLRGAVYFVAYEYADELEALDAVINGVEEADFHMLPLIDDQKQRNMLKNAFEDESMDQAHQLMAEIAELLESNKNVPAKKFADIQMRYSLMKDKMSEYGKLLNDSLSNAQESLTICNKQLAALTKKEMS